MTDRDKSAKALAENERILDRLREGKNSEELLDARFPPVPWVVPGFIAPGLTILAGAPKIGKSWLALGMASALAAGGRVFGEIKVEPCGVLLLALEDTERRLQDRMRRMWIKGSRQLDIRTRWPAGETCLRYLDAWLNEFRGTKAVFIDTLQKVSGVVEINSYRETYGSAAGLKRVADRYSVAIVAMHHTCKVVTQDFVSQVNGSVGLTGAADTVITMQRLRMRNEGVLSVTGRDVEEKEYGIRFDATLGTWTLMDEVPKDRPSWTQSRRRKDRDASGKDLASGEGKGE